MRLNHRGEFVDVINKNKYEILVEIGVREGWYSKYLLEKSNAKLLYSIDPWDFNEENHNPENSFSIAQQNLNCFGERSKMIKAKNEDVINDFVNESVHFVYLDGLHDYDSVKLDIHNWWPKIKNGGILAGHDFHETDWPGIVRAVKEFSKEYNLEINTTGFARYYTGEGDGNKDSWWFIKN